MTRRLLQIGLAATLLSSVGAAPSHAQAVGPDLYRVQAGDTLYRIARANNMTVDRLRRLNTVADDVISVGQTLRLSERVAVPAQSVPAQSPPANSGSTADNRPVQPPGARPPVARPPRSEGAAPPAGAPAARLPAAPANAVAHIVGPGETLFRIAQRYQMPIGELRRLNAVEGDAIQVGQRLVVVPAPGVTPPIRGGVAVNAPPAETAPTVPQPRPGMPVATTRPAVAPARPQPVRLAPPREWSTNATTVPADLVHFVEPGETLFSIAAAYGFSVDALVSGNALTTAPLEPGTVLYLPTPVDPSWAAGRVLPDLFEDGLALVYPDVLTGRPTASGERYDPLSLTASHRDLPLGTLLVVTNPVSGRSTFVRVADRGPVSRAYLVELSAAAASAIELDPNAARRVELRRVP